MAIYACYSRFSNGRATRAALSHRSAHQRAGQRVPPGSTSQNPERRFESMSNFSSIDPYSFLPPPYSSLPKDPPKYEDIYYSAAEGISFGQTNYNFQLETPAYSLASEQTANQTSSHALVSEPTANRTPGHSLVNEQAANQLQVSIEHATSAANDTRGISTINDDHETRVVNDNRETSAINDDHETRVVNDTHGPISANDNHGTSSANGNSKTITVNESNENSSDYDEHLSTPL